MPLIYLIILMLNFLFEGKELVLPKRVKTDPSKVKYGKIVFDLSFDGIMVDRVRLEIFEYISSMFIRKLVVCATRLCDAIL